MKNTYKCHTCIFYSEDYCPDENYTENNCDELCLDNFFPRTECPNYININDALTYEELKDEMYEFNYHQE